MSEPSGAPNPTHEPDAGDVAASKLSAAIARAFLRGGNYPWLKVAGAVSRERSRQRGGHRFVVRRPDYRGRRVTLDAWFSPRHPGTGLGHGSRSRIPVLICHGIFEFKERYFDRAAWLNARGHDVLLFDHRTHGRSTGKRLTMGVLERDDVSAVLDAALDRRLVADERVVTLGFSLGGGTVLQHAAVDPRVAGCIALAPFADFTAAIESFRQCFAPWLDRGWVHRGFDAAALESGFEVQQASALDAIAKIQAPVLLVEAGKDAYLPPAAHSHRLQRQRGDRPLTVLNMPRATHLSLVRRRWPRLDAGIGRFLDGLETEAETGGGQADASVDST